MPSLKRLAQFADMFDCQIADLLTESSRRLDDQSVHLHNLLLNLEESDRVFVIEVVEKLVARLTNPMN